ncbi:MULTISPECIES: serine/threonine-protein kinase [Streptomyces]|uniref:serine/threonine-protein kinase n=1 Tax=Streptomyces TaxID=1883 RepID=UPI001EC6CE07|nr:MULTISPECIES: serine/threonine-protein kinase [Streptomyces]MBZ6137494.1 serine/threonine protein kinase [Streptomyces olivaceus]MBZ6165695.1 serine/threonine protein kinase [Streptomyces olivaceus]
MGLEGRLLGDRYRLLRRAGSGASGTVWRALDEAAVREDDREVAVRRPRLPGDPEEESYRRAAHRLYREARAAARVDHPAAVRIHDVVVEEAGLDGLPWIVMEWVPGESLRDVLLRGPVAPQEAARIGLAVLGALRAAHAVGIVHRAVRPANVLLERHGRVVLTGFGTAHLAGGEPARGTGPAADLRSLGDLLRTAVGDPPPSGPFGALVERLLAGPGSSRPDAEEVAQQLESMVRDLRPAPDRAPDRSPDQEPGRVPDRSPDQEPGRVPDQEPGRASNREPNREPGRREAIRSGPPA